MARNDHDKRNKLTMENVRIIFALYGVVPKEELARKYGVCEASVAHIWYGITWSHVTGKKSGKRLVNRQQNEKDVEACK